MDGVILDADRLKRLDAWLLACVETGRTAGIVAMLRCHGEVVYCGAHGRQSIALDTPIRPDTIFRLHSMTKPITAVAMMKLHERGCWRFDDPLDGVLPELAGLKILAGVRDNGALDLVPAARSPTMAEAMSHTAGFGYGLTTDNPVDMLFRSRNVAGASDVAEFLGRVASIPLIHPPGACWSYSIASDLLGVVVERLAGVSFGAFLHEEIFAPLGMEDTSFVCLGKLARISDSFIPAKGRAGVFVTLSDPLRDYGRTPPVEAGGNGLLSTAGDYSRFCQGLLDSLSGDGVPLLSKESMRHLMDNHVPIAARGLTNNLGISFGDALGYGFGVMVASRERHLPGPIEPAGTISWNGAGGTWFWADPANGLSFVGMTQCMDDPTRNNFEKETRQIIYEF